MPRVSDASGVWDVAVVGAGACGLTIGRNLAAQGHSVVLVDKGSRPGGRLAARRIGDTVVDTAATGVDTDDEVVLAELHQRAGAAFALGDDGTSHWTFGGPANEVARRWLADLTLHRAEITRLERGGDGTLGVIADSTTDPLVARRVVLTAPVPQATAILAASNLAANGVLGTIAYDPAVLLIAALDRPPPQTIEVDPRGPFESIRAGGWGGSTHVVVATARTPVAIDAVAGNAGGLGDELVTALQHHLPGAGITDTDLKVWRYAHATTTVAGDHFLHCEDEPAVLIAGDGFGPPGDRHSGIPRAVRSGLAAAAVCA